MTFDVISTGIQWSGSKVRYVNVPMTDAIAYVEHMNQPDVMGEISRYSLRTHVPGTAGPDWSVRKG